MLVSIPEDSLGVECAGFTAVSNSRDLEPAVSAGDVRLFHNYWQAAYHEDYGVGCGRDTLVQ